MTTPPERPNAPGHYPSPFVRGLLGYGAGAALGLLIALSVTDWPAGFNALAGLTWMLIGGGAGAYLAVRWNLTHSVGKESPARFFGSTACLVLIAIILAVSLAVSLLLAQVYPATPVP